MTAEQRSEERLVVHHVGGRSGSMMLPVAAAYRDQVLTVLYDADEDCVEQIRRESAYYGDARVFPYCLGSADGKLPLHITYDPYATSNLRPDPAFAEYTAFQQRSRGRSHDYLLGEAFDLVETREVQVRSLDSLLYGGQLDCPAPDLLTIDTQGSELDILRGASRVVREHVLAVATEVEFRPVYQGQPCFDEVMRELVSAGFEFCGFLHLDEVAPLRTPVGARGRGLQLWGDALFMKPFAGVLATRDPWLAAHKLAFAALCFGYVELALRTLRDLERAQLVAPARLPRYALFMQELAAEARRLEPLYPPTFAERFSLEASRQRFDAQDLSRPRPSRLRRRVSRLSGSIRKRLGRMQRLHRLRPTGFERKLVEFGLVDVAKLVRERRIAMGESARLDPRGPAAPRQPGR